MTNKSLDNTPTSSSQQQSSEKEGYGFKYNEDGRRYHGNREVAYLLPNDDDEADRLHQQHWVLRYALQCNYFTPVTKLLEEGITVLDSGCGAATWTFEMGETYPQSKIHGIDISFVFPEKIMPANVTCVIGNIAKHIPFPDNTFDYIHQRLLVAGLTSDDWDSALQEQYRVLKPGGYIELDELDFYNLINVGPVWGKLTHWSEVVFNSRNMPLKICGELEDRLAKAGFEKQVTTVISLPVNHNGKVGKLLWDDIKEGCLNLKPVMAKINLEWEDIKVYESYIDACGAEAKEREMKVNHFAFCAQKPSLGTF